MSTDKKLDPNSVVAIYRSLCLDAGMVVSSDGMLSVPATEPGGKPVPVMVGGTKRLVLPVKAQNDVPDWSHRARLHLFSEVTDSAESVTHRLIREQLQLQLNIKLLEIIITLCEIAASPAMHANLSPAQQEFLSHCKLDEEGFDAFRDYIERQGTDALGLLLHSYIRKRGTVDGESYNRVCTVTSPFLKELEDSKSNLNRRLKTKHSEQIAKLLVFLFPELSKGTFSAGSGDLHFPCVDALIKSFAKVVKRIESVAAMFPDHFSGITFDGQWMEVASHTVAERVHFTNSARMIPSVVDEGGGGAHPESAHALKTGQGRQMQTIETAVVKPVVEQPTTPPWEETKVETAPTATPARASGGVNLIDALRQRSAGHQAFMQAPLAAPAAVAPPVASGRQPIPEFGAGVAPPAQLEAGLAVAPPPRKVGFNPFDQPTQPQGQGQINQTGNVLVCALPGTGQFTVPPFGQIPLGATVLSVAQPNTGFPQPGVHHGGFPGAHPGGFPGGRPGGFGAFDQPTQPQVQGQINQTGNVLVCVMSGAGQFTVPPFGQIPPGATVLGAMPQNTGLPGHAAPHGGFPGTHPGGFPGGFPGTNPGGFPGGYYNHPPATSMYPGRAVAR